MVGPAENALAAEVIDLLKPDAGLFRLLFQSVVDYAIFIISPTGHVLTWDLGAKRLKGYDAEEIIGEHVSRFYQPGDAQVAETMMREAAASGRAEAEGWRVRKDGSRFWANVILTALHAPDGSLRGFAKITRDLSERHALERELKRSNAELEQFAYAASHDLRAPLRAVRALAGMLEQDLAGKIDAESADHLALLAHRVGRMEGLLGALLEYARVGRTSEQTAAIEVKTLVDETCALVDLRPGFVFVNRCPVIELTTMKVALERVLLNLIGNALKHHDAATGTITVSASETDELVVFDVEDDGPGIPVDDQERVFRMFQTLRSRDLIEGSGMGLTLVKKIIEQAGGAIRLRSDGRGSRFTFTWPRHWPT